MRKHVAETKRTMFYKRNEEQTRAQILVSHTLLE